jgi:hypothetical protein
VEVHFTPLVADLDEIEAYCRSSSGHPVTAGGSRWAFVLVGVFAVLLLSKPFFPEQVSAWMNTQHTLLMGVLIVLLWFLPGILRQKARRDLHREAARGARRVVLLPEGLKVIGPTGQALVAWDHCAVVETPGLVLFISTANAVYYVPRRAFADEQACSDYMDLIRHYRHDPRLEKAPIIAPPRLPADSLTTRSDEVQDRLR